MKSNFRNSNLQIATLVILSGFLIWWNSRDFPKLPEGHPGPGLFPQIIGLTLVVAGLALLIQFYRRSELRKVIEKPGSGSHPVRILVAVTCVGVFPLLAGQIGFLFTLTIFGIGIGLVFRLKWWHAGLVGILTSAGIYIVFNQLLGVVL